MSDGTKRPLALSGKRLELLASLLAEEDVGQETPQAIPRRKNPLEVPLSFGQRRLWLLDRLENGIHYNDHFDLRLTGPLNLPVLGRAIEEILRRHEGMRSVIAEVEGAPLQSITPAQRLTLSRVDLTGFPDSSRMLGPLWRFTLIALAEEDHLLLITAHHIAIDGWSRGVFLRELSQLYPAFRRAGHRR